MIYSNEEKTANHAYATHIKNPEKVLLWFKPGVQIGLTNSALILAKRMFSEYQNLGFIFLSGLTENAPFLQIQEKIDSFPSDNDSFNTNKVILARPVPIEIKDYRIIYLDDSQKGDKIGFENFRKEYPQSIKDPFVFIKWTTKDKLNKSKIKNNCIMESI